MDSMLTIYTRHGFYNGPYVQSAPLILRTDYLDPIPYTTIQSTLAQNKVVMPDFEILRDETNEDRVRNLYIVILYPGMVFHGRN